MSPFKTILTIAAAATPAVAGAAPAGAATADPTAAAVRALDAHDLLAETPGGSDAAGAVSAESGVTVGADAAAVSLKPATDAAGVSAAGGAAVVYPEAGYQYAVTGEGARADAGYVVIGGSSAPSAFPFAVDAAGTAAQLELTADGSVLVKNTEGEIVNVLGAAWALDAKGVSVPTWYSIDGGVVIQHVDHSRAACPVVADPRLLCDGVFCTVMYNKSETQQIATVSGTTGVLITAGCTALGGPIAGLVCGFSAAYAGQQAQTALNQGKCLGMRALIYLPQSTTHLVIERC
ncbi:hypothetical protein DOE76_11425 [Leifsonia sp. ku-ls]|nr:hypothetical protein DOE76_11425 [Leifsonia sp. ku-ls]